MKYTDRSDTIRIQQVETDELEPGESPDEPEFREFRIYASRIANGWWTRQELTRLRDNINAALSSARPLATGRAT